MPSSSSAVLESIDKLRKLAEQDAQGDAQAHVRLLKEIHALTLVAETPTEKTMRIRFQILQNLCVRIAIEYDWLKTIAAKKGESITAAELAEQTKSDELLIIRVMRLVTYVGICTEAGESVYAANDCTEFIVQKAWTGAELHHTDLGFPIGGKLVEMMRGHGIHQFPTPPQKSPFEYTFGAPIFEYLHIDGEQKQAFDDYMAVRRDPKMPQWFDIFPIAKELQQSSSSGSAAASGDERALLVDVGGGYGHEAQKLKARYPDLSGRVVCQDQPATIEEAKAQEGASSKGVELIGHDFFTPQPIKGAKYYYLRNILHDWPDDKCKTILSQLVTAMDKNASRLLIDDYVLPSTKADMRAASMDFLMMIYASGIERTTSQWTKLLSSVGLEIVKVWSLETSHESIIETRIKQ